MMHPSSTKQSATGKRRAVREGRSSETAQRPATRLLGDDAWQDFLLAQTSATEKVPELSVEIYDIIIYAEFLLARTSATEKVPKLPVEI